MAVTIDSVRATCEVIGHLPTMLLQPLLHSIAVVSILLSLVYGLAWLLSTGKVEPMGRPLEQGGLQIAGVERALEFSGFQWFCIVWWLFGLVWIFETVNALGQFAISHAVVNFSCHDVREPYPMLRGYFIGVVYHLGTLAFGGFVIGCLKVIAVIFAFILKQTQSESGVQGAVSQVLCCCCIFCFACIERVLAMVNDLVYTDVALQASGYVQAAENVVRMAASSPITYASIKASATVIRVLGVSIIGGVGTFSSYQALSSTALHKQLDSVFQNSSMMLPTSNIIGTTIASSFICFYIAMAFMMVFYQTTYSLMYCMLMGAATEGGRSPDPDKIQGES
eukprot:TRINITY_DN93304_c0_g1_i1.p1 TRINITY_DN93304_c0_g1~~TRINITY_DN93304_c0_g1_i1.p1  ORF type:complete len:348 (+),score=29.20 TRINITY_DN93304_c0_g1_i1:35-1045(+)